MDGVRALWNGGALVSKDGKKIYCPDWYIEGLPSDIKLDGELWLGRGTHDLLRGILQSSDNNLAWKQISFVIFDFPGNSNPYEIRIRDLANTTLPQHVNIVDTIRCRGRDHLQEYMEEILRHGGEGLMSNKPNSVYTALRIKSLLKVKVIFQIFCDFRSHMMTVKSKF
jgi:DNA ligase-1